MDPPVAASISLHAGVTVPSTHVEQGFGEPVGLDSGEDVPQNKSYRSRIPPAKTEFPETYGLKRPQSAINRFEARPTAGPRRI